MSVRSLALTLVVALCALFGVTASAVAAPSDLDKTYGSGGLSSPSYPSGLVIPQTSTLQADGKLIVGGLSYGIPPVQNYKQLVARFNVDGSPDLTFGTGGITLVDYEATGTVDEAITDVIVLADGRILASGIAGDNATEDSTVTRFLANGNLDTTFGTAASGKRRYAQGDASTSDYAIRLIAGPAGSTYVAGTAYRSSDDDSYVMKIDSAGVPIASFGDFGGTQYIDYACGAGNNDAARDLKLLGDGKLLLLSSCDFGIGDGALVTRLDGDDFGEKDVNFGTNGDYTWSAESYSYVFGLAVQSSGRIVIAASPDSVDGLKLHGIKPDGSDTDTTFGISGEAEVKLPGTDIRLNRLVQTSGDGLLAGGNVDSSNRAAVFVRTTAGGAGLGTFGTGGVTVVPGTAGASITAAAVQKDGRYIGVGFADANPSLQLMRLIGDGPEPAPPPAPVALSTKIKSPSKSKLKASKLKSIAGTATGTGLVKVQLAIQRVDPKLLKKSKRCLFVTGSKGKTKKFKPVKKKCAPTKYLTAKGTTNWSYKIKLKPGKYKLFLVGVGDGARVSKTTTKTFTLTK